MREIKFRAWFEDEMLDHEKLVYMDQETHAMYTVITNEKREDGVTFMQYTGLKDKNGVEIYEGDIVEGRNRARDWSLIRQQVTFLNGCFMFGGWNAHEYFNKHVEKQIVGNVHENPGLLEDAQ